MDMNDKDNQLIQSFFDSHRQAPLPDNGFSERVMRQIPRHRIPQVVVRSRWWTALCCCVAIVAFVFLGGENIVKGDLIRLLSCVGTYLFRIAARPGVVALIYLGFLVLVAFGIYDIATTEYRFSKSKKREMECARS